ncbi:hypothetical protein ACVWZX_004425 [Deinococcus sp. UYEF24]
MARDDGATAPRAYQCSGVARSARIGWADALGL